MHIKGIFKKATTCILTLSMVLSYLTFTIDNNTVSAAGVDTDGYTLIGTAKELDSLVRNNLSGKYRLTNNIDLTNYISATNTKTNGWIPIGASQAFTGIFDGNGHRIKGLWSSGSGSYVGLFSKANGATIKNLDILVGPRGISGTSYVGIVVGEARRTTFQNLELKLREYEYNGKITARNNIAGGVAGYVGDYSSLRHVYVDIDVSAHGYAGGSVGILENNSSISSSTAAGDVVVNVNYAGGLVGQSVNSNISDTYALGNVTGEHLIGGLVGYCSSGSIEHSYIVGIICARFASDTGAFVGAMVDGARFTGTNYFNYQRAGLTRAVGQGSRYTGVSPQAKTQSEMMHQSTFVGWDFDTTWWQRNGVPFYDYPYLRFQKIPELNEFNITFDKNSPYATGIMAVQKVTANTSTPLTKNAFTLEDHVLLGWSTTPAGNVEYADGAMITTNKNVILYAVWGTPDLYMNWSADKSEIVTGEIVTLSYNIGNSATPRSTTFYNSYLEMKVPVGVEYVYGSVTGKLNGGSIYLRNVYDPVTRIIRVDIGEIEPGQDFTINYQAIGLASGQGQDVQFNAQLYGTMTYDGTTRGVENSKLISSKNVKVKILASNPDTISGGNGNGGGTIGIGGGITIGKK